LFCFWLIFSAEGDRLFPGVPKQTTKFLSQVSSAIFYHRKIQKPKLKLLYATIDMREN
jgi:hypothetical protein